MINEVILLSQVPTDKDIPVYLVVARESYISNTEGYTVVWKCECLAIEEIEEKYGDSLAFIFTVSNFKSLREISKVQQSIRRLKRNLENNIHIYKSYRKKAIQSLKRNQERLRRIIEEWKKEGVLFYDNYEKLLEETSFEKELDREIEKEEIKRKLKELEREQKRLEKQRKKEKPQKKCSICGKLLRKWQSKYCSKCAKDYPKNYYLKNKEKFRAYAMKSYWKHKKIKNCVICDQPLGKNEIKYCSACRVEGNLRRKRERQRIRRIEQGKCCICHEYLIKKENHYCSKCRTSLLEKLAKKYREDTEFREREKLRAKIYYNPDRFKVGDYV